MFRTHSGTFVGCALISVGLLIADPLLAADAPPDKSWLPTVAVVAELEHGLSLPERAYALTKYTRYYTGVIRDGHRVVRGVFIGGASKVVIVESERGLPGVMDGGCYVVNIDYDVEAHKVLQIFCNGYA